MSSSGAPSREVRALAATAAVVEDAALLKLVQLMDSLPSRGDADSVLDPVRSRLLGLRPRRPLRLARLLFLPLDGAIIAPAHWRRGGYEVPRSAVAPIAGAIEAALGPAAEALRREAARATTEDEALIAALGARLWPAAAAALPEQPPPGWREAGLAPADYPGLCAVIAPLLSAGVPMHAALSAAAQGPPANLVRTALAGPAAAGDAALAAAIATLLRRAAAPGGVLLAASEFGVAARAVGTRMADVAMAQLPDLAEPSLREAPAAAARLFAGTANLALCGVLDAERVRRLMALQHAAEATCRRRVTEAGMTQVVAALSTLADAGAASDEAMAEVEGDARAIRALAQIARRAGESSTYDRTLRHLAERVGTLRRQAREQGGDGVTLIDLARVMEILAGPEAAAALLNGAASA
jgi:hypothetical protein